MSEYVSPVPLPAADAVPPEPYREIYGMPVFVTVPTRDLESSKDFWIRGLGFIDLFSVPGQVTHLRRWAFQDVLLVPGEPGEPGGGAPAVSVSFACVLGQIDEIAARCEELVPGCTSGPVDKPWNSVELEVVTPESARVVMTAARPLDPDGPQAAWMREAGLEVPRP
ncbi:VOC family protein [Actinomadura opuntiae]|uniref:VOC family protein n=1 Tax=Actinomadura sp. OS1-43 TaxID=604315 RepID=UPI00255A9978|nr:VOC family protein [Actinomadura sp. OS1-43]MDL4818231.1 VOC family protein [Actinomadura sp. OS1-43]